MNTTTTSDRIFPMNWVRQYPEGIEYNDTLWHASGLKARHPSVKPGKIALRVGNRYAVVKDSDEYKKPLVGEWILYFREGQWTENLSGVPMSTVDVPYLLHCHTYATRRLEKARETYARGLKAGWSGDFMQKLSIQGQQYRLLTNDLQAEIDERTTGGTNVEEMGKAGWQYASVDAYLLYLDCKERRSTPDFMFGRAEDLVDISFQSSDVIGQRDVKRFDSWTEEREYRTVRKECTFMGHIYGMKMGEKVLHRYLPTEDRRLSRTTSESFTPAFRQLWKLSTRLKDETAQRSQEEAILHAWTTVSETLTALQSYEIPADRTQEILPDLRRLAAWTPKEGISDWTKGLRADLKELAKATLETLSTYDREAINPEVDYDEFTRLRTILRWRKKQRKALERRAEKNLARYLSLTKKDTTMKTGRPTPLKPMEKGTSFPGADPATLFDSKREFVKDGWGYEGPTPVDTSIGAAEIYAFYPKTISPPDERKPSQERELIPLHELKR